METDLQAGKIKRRGSRQNLSAGQPFSFDGNLTWDPGVCYSAAAAASVRAGVGGMHILFGALVAAGNPA